MARFSYENLNDQELIERCITRDPLAWGQFVERFSKLVFWAIKERLSSWGCYCSQEDLCDIFQNVFTTLWIKNSFKQIKNRSRVKTWLIMVAGNMAIDYVRKNSLHALNEDISIYQSISERLPQDEEDVTFEYVLGTNSGDPRSELIASETKHFLDEEIKKLDSKEKTVLALDIIYDVKHKDIAEIVKLPVGTVSTIIARSKEKLRQGLKEKGVEII